MKQIPVKHKIMALYFIPKEKLLNFHTKHTTHLNEQIIHMLGGHH